ncbi:hypothetical protein CASFOL_001709 [Castilleja foliolosa]|uniref:Uncharacterized protein n=1 Tax=Castilleja foliolosa TaxID=1961234 RepID=A0ABD3EC59_9LAMI
MAMFIRQVSVLLLIALFGAATTMDFDIFFYIPISAGVWKWRTLQQH